MLITIRIAIRMTTVEGAAGLVYFNINASHASVNHNTRVRTCNRLQRQAPILS